VTATTLTRSWREPAATRDGLGRLIPLDAELWASRLLSDRRRAARHQTTELARITAAVESRARRLGAAAVVLTGSTARGRRSAVSDLDYHVIGACPDLGDLRAEIDLYCDRPAELMDKLERGDDFAHWTVRHGCVLFDSGALREAAAQAADRDLWPDPERKLRQARPALGFAEQLIASGDNAAALEQVRGALSLTARWWLLAHDVFPLARAELPAQLAGVDQPALARALEASIHGRPDVDSLAASVTIARSLTG
jgi:predicted nucleotidyltransferase